VGDETSIGWAVKGPPEGHSTSAHPVRRPVHLFEWGGTVIDFTERDIFLTCGKGDQALRGNRFLYPGTPLGNLGAPKWGETMERWYNTKYIIWSPPPKPTCLQRIVEKISSKREIYEKGVRRKEEELWVIFSKPYKSANMNGGRKNKGTSHLMTRPIMLKRSPENFGRKRQAEGGKKEPLLLESRDRNSHRLSYFSHNG